jgi:hypothetical protein
MRWVVEVTSGEKTELQKYVVEAESWQRALQAARADRGESGPMSGFSIELLDEGYRAVDPIARNKFVVKRAPDDMPITVKPKDSKAPTAAKSIPPKAPTASKSLPPTASKSIPPRPSAAPKAAEKEEKKEDKKKSRAERKSEKMKAAALKKEADRAGKSVTPPAVIEEIEPEELDPKTESQPDVRPPQDSIPPAPLLPIGAFVPGLPSVKLQNSREQNPSDQSPLAYREYAFSTKAGTSEEVAEKILRAQLKIIQAHLEKLKPGKLVNLAVFDVEFTGKPPAPPLCTLAWKDWKGDPVVAFPRRGGGAKQVKPPTAGGVSVPPSVIQPPASMPPAQPQPIPIAPPVVQMPPGYSQPPPPPPTPQPAMSAVPRPPGAIAAMVGAAQAIPAEPTTQAFPPAPPGSAPAAANPFTVPAAAGSAPGAANPFANAPPAGAPVGPSTSPMMVAAAPVAQVAQVSAPPAAASAPANNPFNTTQPMTAVAIPATAPASFPPPAMPAPVIQQAPSPAPQPVSRSSRPPPDGVVRTPSGRFVRGRVSGDELITQLFESMHDLHFLRDALDGGQFCLALATEMIPARCALIHFFDVEKRQWIVACTRGKDAQKLLTMNTPESDDLLRAAARHRRAIVTPNGAHAQAQRYQTLGGAKSMIIAPIMQAGRALGAMEIINPMDGAPFTEDEGNAMTYIAEQYAEYLGSRGIVVHPDRIRSAASS